MIANPIVTQNPDIPPFWWSAFPPFKFKLGDGAGVVSSSVSVTVGGAGGLCTVGAGAGA